MGSKVFRAIMIVVMMAGLLGALPGSQTVLGQKPDAAESSSKSPQQPFVKQGPAPLAQPEKAAAAYPPQAAAEREAMGSGAVQWLKRAVEGLEMQSNSGADLAYPSSYRWLPKTPNPLGFDVLVYADDPYHSPTYPEIALQTLGITYTLHTAGDFAGFETDIYTNTWDWDMVIFANDYYSPPTTTLQALSDYLYWGGKAIAHTWAMTFNLTSTLWTNMGVSFIANDELPPDPVYWWDDSHSYFNDPESVPEFTAPVSKTYSIYGQYLEPLPGFQALAGYTAAPAADSAALIVGNEGRTVFRGFLDGQQDADLDGDLLADGVELWIDLIYQTLPEVEYVAATWDDVSVHLLDGWRRSIRSFPTLADQPNGIATDGSLIYTGHFNSTEMIAYDFFGAEQFRWSAPELDGLQGMELVDGELAVYNDAFIHFFNPANGDLLRSIPSAALGTIEALAYDGELLWQLGDATITATLPSDGSYVRAIPNPASACQYGGTGLTADGPHELTAACTSGEWYKIDSLSGSLWYTSTNGLNMYGLKALPTADLVVTMTLSADTVAPGETVSYTAAVESLGPLDGTDVNFSSPLPLGGRPESWSASGPGCTLAGDLISCAIPELAAPFEIHVTYRAGDLVTALGFTAEATSEKRDSNPYNNKAYADVLIDLGYTPHDCTVGAVINNCSFETGFTGWITKEIATPLYTLTVTSTGVLNDDYGFFASEPTQGSYALVHGFDGAGPDFIRLYQDVTLPETPSRLFFDYRAGWDLRTFNYGMTEARIFRVKIEPAGGGTPLQFSRILVAPMNTIITDTGNQNGVVDLIPFAGMDVRIVFEWEVPHDYSGPAYFQLDNIDLLAANPTYLPMARKLSH